MNSFQFKAGGIAGRIECALEMLDEPNPAQQTRYWERFGKGGIDVKRVFPNVKHYGMYPHVLAPANTVSGVLLAGFDVYADCRSNGRREHALRRP